MITRRHCLGFLASGLVAAPFAAEAQRSGNTVTIGFLSERSLPPPYIDALRRGLTERGWAEGRSFRIEQRSADGDLERLPGLVAELIGIGVTVIVTGIGTPAALAAKRATAKIPIVFVTGGDPVDFGIVSNREKPGGNITGFGGGITAIQKRLDLLREVSPGVKRIAFLRNLTNPIHPKIFSAVERAGGSLGLTLHEVGVFEATEFEGIFKTMQSSRFDALFVPGDAMFSRHRALLVELAAKTRLPAIYGDRLFPDGGGLMSFSVDLVELCRRAAGHVDRILRGAQAGDLPVEDAVKFEVVINLKAAQALGLTIPAALRQEAEIVEAS
jgi:putative tryptophan/tyrosine transport system substrate-binding protein